MKWYILLGRRLPKGYQNMYPLPGSHRNLQAVCLCEVEYY